MRNSNRIPTLLTILQFANKHPAFPQRTLRDFIYKSKPRKLKAGPTRANGFARVIVRHGTRILIDEEAFFFWLDSKQPRASRKRPVATGSAGAALAAAAQE